VWNLKNGWKEVARLGTGGMGYPHVLVDAYGWCLRLGPNSRSDDKYYSRLETLLEGLIVHLVRRRMMSLRPILDLRGLVQEISSATRMALSMTEKIDKETLSVRASPSTTSTEGPEASRPLLSLLRVFHADQLN
jgi:hypothetical protein